MWLIWRNKIVYTEPNIETQLLTSAPEIALAELGTKVHSKGVSLDKREKDLSWKDRKNLFLAVDFTKNPISQYLCFVAGIILRKWNEGKGRIGNGKDKPFFTIYYVPSNAWIALLVSHLIFSV